MVVPRRNLVPKPASLTFEEAACLPTAWLTAYRMLFTQGGLKAGDTVLVQGAGGGVATALITLARAGGLRVLATSRDEAKRARALEIGAHEVFESGARLPVKVDAVMETVGRATWSHSIRSLRPGGAIVISGTTSGPKLDDAELTRIFFLQLRVIGSTMGTRGELESLVTMLDATGARPLIDRVLPMDRGPRGLRRDGEGRRLRQDRLHPMTRHHLVTGAGSGIGAALAGGAARARRRPRAAGPQRPRADELAATYPGAATLVADLADPPGPRAGPGRGRPARRPRLGGPRRRRGRPGPGRGLDLADWQRQLDVNLTAPAVLTRAALPALRAARGLVLFVNSGAGLAAHPDWSAYAASKFGLRALADALRGEEAGTACGSPRSTPAAPPPRCRRRCTARRAGTTTPRPGSTPETVAATILHVLDLPRDATIPEVSVHPAPR